MSAVGGIGGAGSTGYTPAPRPAQKPAAPAGGPSFAQELGRTGGAQGEGAKGVQFSKHAAERVQRRGIGANDPATVQRLEKGVELAAKKGSRAAVVLVDSTAYVVAPQNKTVITAVDQSQMKEQVFTNIDTAVIA
jgi:flagellar operon protein